MFRQQQFRRFSRPSSQGGVPAYIKWTPMILSFGAGTVTYLYYKYLDEVPLTGRRRWIATSPEFEQKLGDENFKALLKQFHSKILPPDHRASRTVQRVGSRIASATQDFCKQHNLTHLCDRPFTYTVVRSDQANAFVLPGNHIFVLTGLFKYVRDEDELAGVLGHEMAHNVARHVGEKLSENIVIHIIANIFLLIDPSGAITNIFTPTAAIFSSLPHSREAESEADRIGLELSARACFDPRAAKKVFAAMKEGMTTDGVHTPPEFISTHPSNDRRIAKFDEWLPSAMETFNGDDFGDKCRRVREDMAEARRRVAIDASSRGN